jgi:hypothetical protein
MWGSRRTVIFGVALCALAGAAAGSTHASQIIGLSVAGQAGIGIQFDGGVLSTPGAQHTPVRFDTFLDWLNDIPAATATFTLDGLSRAGPAVVFHSSVIQRFRGGTFSLRHPSGSLLLSGDLHLPALTGAIGAPGDMLFTTSFSTVSGGTLAPYLDAASLVLQMHMSNINGGQGISVTPLALPMAGELRPFTAEATVDVEAERNPIPEPATVTLLGLCGMLASVAVRRGRRR